MIVSALTAVAPSVEFVHGMLARSAGLLTEVHDRIRTLITLSYAVSCDETPLKVGPKTPKVGKKKTERYLLVAATELDTHYLLGDRSLGTFTAFLLAELTNGDRARPLPKSRKATSTGVSLSHFRRSGPRPRFAASLPAGPDQRTLHCVNIRLTPLTTSWWICTP